MPQDTLKTFRERTRIVFPRQVLLGELREIFDVVADAIPCDISYATELSEKRTGRNFRPGEPFLSELYVRKLSGRLLSGDVRGAGFTCDIDNDYDNPSGPVSRFKGIEFLVTPGYESVGECVGRAFDDIGTMDAMRMQVDRYFVDHPDTK